MSRTLFKKLYPFMGVALSLSLTACPSPNSTEAPETPTATETPTEPEQTAETHTTPTEASSNLLLKVKGHADLRNFVIAQVQGVCVSDIGSLKTVLNLPSAPNAELLATLKAAGAEVDGNTVTLMTDVPSVDALIKGFDLSFANLPEGQLSGQIDLNNASGNSMGSMGFSLDYKAGENKVDILLNPADTEPNPKGCIPIIPDINGAELTATAGGLLVELPSETPSTSSGDGENNSEEANTGPEPVEGPEGLAGIRLDVDNRFITALGETRQLSVTLLDSSGNPLPKDGVVIEWSSNRPHTKSRIK